MKTAAKLAARNRLKVGNFRENTSSLPPLNPVLFGFALYNIAASSFAARSSYAKASALFFSFSADYLSGDQYCSLPIQSNAASAQGFVKVKKDTLEQVQFYKAPRHIMILDESPRVTDHRKPINQENNILIAIPPLQSGKPGSTITLSPERNSLPQANFTSNIPAKGLLANQNLTPVRQGGLAPAEVLKTPANQESTARPLMNKSSTKIRHKSPSQYAPAAYPEYTGSGASFSDGHTTTAVTAS